MDQMAALSHLRSLIRVAKTKSDVETLHQALEEMLRFVEKSLGAQGLAASRTTHQPPEIAVRRADERSVIRHCHVCRAADYAFG